MGRGPLSNLNRVTILPLPPMRDEIEPILALRGITKSFGGVFALQGVDFTLNRGEIHGLVGENGAGKSTLMKIIAGAQTEFQGAMLIDGAPTRFRSAHDAMQAGIGMVHQELSIAPDLTVSENMFLGRQLTNRLGIVDWRLMAKESAAHLKSLGIGIDPRARAGALPLGLQQLVELGRVLFSGARIIILDEPTSALSPPEVQLLFRVLDILKRKGASLIFISHFLDDDEGHSDGITVVRNGRVVATTKTALIEKSWIIDKMIGGTKSHPDMGANVEQAILTGHSDAPPALEARALCGAKLGGVSLKVSAGEILGVYGFMGSGHSELGQVLVGKTKASAGQILMSGKPVRISNTAAAKRTGIACLPDSRRQMLFAMQPIYKNISISILERLATIFLRPARERRVASERIAELGVRPPRPDWIAGGLSGGNQQKVALARWLTHLPKVLILNEPTRGIDVGAKEDVVNIVRSIRKNGIAVILVSTEPELILALSDRIVVMQKGRVSKEFAAETVGKDRLLAVA
jgi:ribose transport system ATP-binding protein